MTGNDQVVSGRPPLEWCLVPSSFKDPTINLSFLDVGQGDLTQRGTASLFADSAIFYPEIGWVRVDTISDTEMTGAMAWETVPQDGSPVWRAVGGFSVPYCP